MITLKKDGRTYIIKGADYISFPRVEFISRTAVVSLYNTDSTVNSDNIRLKITAYNAENTLVGVKNINKCSGDIDLSDILTPGEEYRLNVRIVSFDRRGITYNLSNISRDLFVKYNKANIYNFTYVYDSVNDIYIATAKPGISYFETYETDSSTLISTSFPKTYNDKHVGVQVTKAGNNLTTALNNAQSTNIIADFSGLFDNLDSIKPSNLDKLTAIIDTTGLIKTFSYINGNYNCLYLPNVTNYEPMNNLGTIFVPSSMKDTFLEEFAAVTTMQFPKTSDGWTTLGNGKKLKYYPFIYTDNYTYTDRRGGHIWPPRVPEKFRRTSSNGKQYTTLFMPAQLESGYPNDNYPRAYGPYDDTYIKKEDLIKAIKTPDSDRPFIEKPRYVDVTIPEYKSNGVTIKSSTYTYLEFVVSESVIGLGVSAGGLVLDNGTEKPIYIDPDGGTRCYVPSPLVSRKRIEDKIVIGIPCKLFENNSYSTDDIKTYEQAGWLFPLSYPGGIFIHPITPRGIQAITGSLYCYVPIDSEEEDIYLKRRYTFTVYPSKEELMKDEQMYPITVKRNDVIFEKPEITQTSYGGK